MDDLAGKTPDIGATPARPRPRLLIPFVVASGLFMEGLDSTVIATALPQIAHNFHEPTLNLTAAVTSYLLSLAVFIPISGWVADRFGARNVFCSAVLLFTLGSALCGASQSLHELVAMRILQGLGGAMMTPVGRLILLRSFPKAEMVTAMTYVTIPALVGPAIGPIVGGFFAGYLSWRWIFYVNLPIGLIACAFAWRHIEDFRLAKPQPFDFTGFLMCGSGLALLQFAIENTGRSLLAPAMVAAIYGAGGLCLLAYARHARHAANPAVDLGLFRIKTFRIGVLTGGLVRIPLGGTPFLLPLLLQVGFGYSPLESGLHTACLAVGAVLVKSATRRLLGRFGYRSLLTVNSVLVGVTLIGMALFQKDTAGWLIAGYLLMTGCLRSLQFTGVNTLGYSDVPPELTSKGTSVASVAQQLSMSIGVAVASAMLAQLAHGGPVTVTDFRIVLVAFGLFAILVAGFFLQLGEADGEAVSGHHAAHHEPLPHA
jgi:EmrB/QacA subfamily drug resistance transporter